MDAKLVVIGGKANKNEVKLKLPTIVGRDRNAGVTIAHATVSRRHCEIAEVDGALVVRDFGSTNGTYIDDARIQEEAVLMPGAKLTVGPLSFRAEYEHVGPYPSIGVLPPPGSISDTQPFEPHPEYAQDTGSLETGSSDELMELEEVLGDQEQEQNDEIDFLAEPPPMVGEVEELPAMPADGVEPLDFGDELAEVAEVEQIEEQPLAEDKLPVSPAEEDAAAEVDHQVGPIEKHVGASNLLPPPAQDSAVEETSLPASVEPFEELVSRMDEEEFVPSLPPEPSDEVAEVPEIADDFLAAPPQEPVHAVPSEPDALETQWLAPSAPTEAEEQFVESAAVEVPPESLDFLEESPPEPMELPADETSGSPVDSAPAVDATVNWMSEPPNTSDGELNLFPAADEPTPEESDRATATRENSLPAAMEEEAMELELLDEAEPAAEAAEEVEAAEEPIDWLPENDDAPPSEAAEEPAQPTASAPKEQAEPPSFDFGAASQPASVASRSRPAKKARSWWPFGKKKTEKQQALSESEKRPAPSPSVTALPPAPSEMAEKTADVAAHNTPAEMETVLFNEEAGPPTVDIPKPDDDDLTSFFKSLGQNPK